MNELFWKLVAYVVSRRAVSDWIIARAQRTPYWHLEGYMDRWWFLNPYPNRSDDPDTRNRLMRALPSIRVHHILRADLDRNLHDHPWNARTIILRGAYVEKRLVPFLGQKIEKLFNRNVGDTATLKFREFHTIALVSPGGVWTLFLTWKYQGTWGFLTDEGKIPHKEYLS